MSISPRAYGYTGTPRSAHSSLRLRHAGGTTRAEIYEMPGFHTPENGRATGRMTQMGRRKTSFASPAEQPLSVSVRGHSPARAATGEMRPTFVAVEADIDSPNRIISTCGFAVRTPAMYRQSSAQVVALRA